MTFLLVTLSWLFRVFFFSWPSSAWKNSLWAFFGTASNLVFSWLFRGPHLGQILRVLALDSLAGP